LSFRRQELAKNAFAAFLFQIVFAAKRMYRAQTKSLTRSRQKFPRTAVIPLDHQYVSKLVGRERNMHPSHGDEKTVRNIIGSRIRHRREL
jgi:hypothetical protein